MPRRTGRALLAAAAAGLAAIAVAGCDTDPGAAAIVGNQRITDVQLTGYVRDALASPSFASQVTDRQALTRDELSERIQLALLTAAAASQGIHVTDAQVASTIQQYAAQAGGRAALEGQAAQQGVAPSDLSANIRLGMLIDALARRAGVSDPTSAQGQQQAELVAARTLQTESRRLGVRINPRYGTWNPKNLRVTAVQFDFAHPAT